MIVIKAQYSMEFILVFAFSLLILIPIIAFMNQNWNENKDVLDKAQASEIIDKISLAAQNLYYQGPPTRTTLDLQFPKGITDIEVTSSNDDSGAPDCNNYELILHLKDGSELVALLPFEIVLADKKTDPAGIFSIKDGRRKIMIQAMEYKDANNPAQPVTRCSGLNTKTVTGKTFLCIEDATASSGGQPPSKCQNYDPQSDQIILPH